MSALSPMRNPSGPRLVDSGFPEPRLPSPDTGSMKSARRPRPTGSGDVKPGEFLGRQAEIRHVMTALAAARSGRGSGIFVMGEPGVGKTRLATEALSAAEATGMITSRGRTGTVGSVVPYRPLVEALLSLARADLLPGPDELGPYGPVLTHLLPEAPATDAGAVSYLMVAEAVLRVLAVVGGRHGCLLVLDDLHDADMETLAVVEYLLDNVGEQPTVLLLIARQEPGVATDLAARAQQRGSASALELRPLGRPDVHLLLAAGLGVDPSEVSAALVDQVVADSAGLPLVVQGVLQDLARHPRQNDVRRLPVPAALTRSVRHRSKQLGPRAQQILGIAALFGRRFPLLVLRHAIGCDDGELFRALHSAVASYLIEPDGSRPEWYAFRPALAAQALLDDLGPGERAEHARRVMSTLIDLYPGLPGEWCVRAAELCGHTGDTHEAVLLYCEAARRAMAEGAVERAVTLLTQAHQLCAGIAPDLRATVLELLLHAVACSAGFEAVPELAVSLEALGENDVSGPRRAHLYAQLADITALAGRPADALRHLGVARRLLGDSPSAAHTAPVDAAAACVELSRPAPDRLHTAAEFARRAADAAQHAALPNVLGRALLVLGYLAWEQREEAASAHFACASAIAHQHRLPVLRVSADVYLARLAARRDGRTTRVEEARQEALRVGVLPLAYETGCVLALAEVQRGEFEAAGHRIREGLTDATRLRLRPVVAMLRLAEAVRYAHQGRRAEMLEALGRLHPCVDDVPGLRSASYGLARAFCSLLEEDRDAADQEFAQALAYDTENPGTGEFGTYGKYGVMLLRGVLAGRVGWQRYADVTRTGAGASRWNRQFAGMAHAVLLGREGRATEATAAATAALEEAAVYPVARNLCLRLVALSAYEDGWGEPVDWVREAEQYFHGVGILAVASACRSLLRRMGVPVRQRRTGTEQIPLELRRHGVTFREFEVGRLLAERIGNKDIAERLHISPRTVEKHVANLLQKTGHPDRSAFAVAARDVPGWWPTRR